MALTRQAVREIDCRATEDFGIPSIVLMENAGRNAAELLNTLNPLRLRVAIACGHGNNGGDGLVMARHLDRLGHTVNVLLFADPKALSPDAAVNHRIVERMGLPISLMPTPSPSLFQGYGWIADALFGTGLSRAPSAPFDAVINAINDSGAKILAVDVPSGLDCDTGRPLGECIRASHTVTFVGMKEGFLFPEARQFVGELHFADIGAPRRLIDEYQKM
jgi:NAD(P)H-hydrate epimerase